jgi:hypothetical protein
MKNVDEKSQLTKDCVAFNILYYCWDWFADLDALTPKPVPDKSSMVITTEALEIPLPAREILDSAFWRICHCCNMFEEYNDDV